MDIVTLILIAVSLAMDAFAVSVGSGMLMCLARWRPTLKIAGSFGLFQALMPLIGYAVARTFAQYIQAVDHWVAFILLGFIGGKMLYDALTEQDDTPARANPCDWRNLFVMSVATSIDALAVGVTFAFLQVSILPAVSFIGVTTFVLSALGVWVGSAFGARWRERAEQAGGIILILMGVKILAEHVGLL